jgi:exosome complex component RRP40
MAPELACVSTGGRADGLGPLDGGYVFDTDTMHTRKLLQREPEEIQLLQRALKFEMAVGVNGRVWVNSSSCKNTAAIVQVLRATARVPSKQAATQLVTEHLARLHLQ